MWQAQLEDIYRQRFYSFKHAEPLGDWTLGVNAGYFDAREDGRKIAGDYDNHALFSLFSAKTGGHTFYMGYQQIGGDDGFIQVGANTNPMGNTLRPMSSRRRANARGRCGMTTTLSPWAFRA